MPKTKESVFAPEITSHGHPQFYGLLEQIAQLHSNKNHDYSTGDDPLSTFYHSEMLGIPAHIGIFVRLGDKYSRQQSLAVKKAKVAESLCDTLKDSAVYSLLANILIEDFNKCPDKDKIIANLNENMQLLLKWRKYK
jgi:hypothetical protein